MAKVRNRTMAEMNQGMKDKTDKFEKEKLQLSDKNRELASQVETLTGQLEEMKKVQQQQEDELKEVKNNKELLSQVSDYCTYEAGF